MGENRKSNLFCNCLGCPVVRQKIVFLSLRKLYAHHKPHGIFAQSLQQNARYQTGKITKKSGMYALHNGIFVS